MTLQSVVLTLYAFCLFLLTLYGVHRIHVIHLYRRHRNAPPLPSGTLDPLPVVTVQLPVYNEIYVLERLIRAVCAFRYPKDRLEIQVLDDSTDETKDLAEVLCREYRERGFDIHHLHRDNRSGFKAGALAAGLARARGEFVAIFDADFVPEPEMIENTIHHFADPRVGMVQTRWGHVNREYSLLTNVQAIFLDGHFVLEHTARNRSGRFFNFNGTAGVWRRTCIEDAGGWHHDTLTEDLDLSYRAQLRGWNFVFLKDVVSPAEVPVEMNAFKSQQHRWAKGSIQTCKKLLPAVWRSGVPFGVKLEATFHLTANFAYLLVVVLSLLMLPTVLYRTELAGTSLMGILIDASLAITASISVGCFYAFSQREIDERWIGRLTYLPFALAVGIGLSLNNARAVIEALLGHQSSFSRTPKYNVLEPGDRSWKEKKYGGVASLLPYAELALAGYFAVIVAISVANRFYFSAAFLSLFLLGFLYVGSLSLLQRRMSPALRERLA